MKYRQISKKASAAAIVTFALAATGCLISPDQKEVNVETSATSATTVETTAETTAETSAEKNSESKDIAKEGKKKVKKDVSKPAPKAEESDPADENTDVEAPSTDAAATPVSETQMTDELMGYKEWTIKEYAVEWGDQYHNYEFYANDGTMLGYYGGAKNDFGIKDIDGDGISELICNNEYSGDGAKTAIVFRNNNGKIEMAEANDFDYITKVTHNSELMATSFDTYFDSESGNLKLFDKANNRTLPYDYSALIFVPLNNY